MRVPSRIQYLTMYDGTVGILIIFLARNPYISLFEIIGILGGYVNNGVVYAFVIFGMHDDRSIHTLLVWK